MCVLSKLINEAAGWLVGRFGWNKIETRGNKRRHFEEKASASLVPISTLKLLLYVAEKRESEVVWLVCMYVFARACWSVWYQISERMVIHYLGNPDSSLFYVRLLIS